ncbi:hypothetical protein Ae168Ps1_3564c [Pseudonocardia sp. Ae168_Ps1]|uniref:hypothetical protein n=2 Tax=unclassified Pseudonocardia TaxID=2619320 RepID=UPI00094B45F8|nr:MULTISPECIES: hypothetical protein [unclassified Pseudonocardia]OLL75164.1 hypothetical protein Ae150APs1_3542c [Pseudonocardia sp. Ae150A_Ps1]OLL81158.1 hypothetical protein Ae168Ps1_3564c [Pseudonocardia sp. Ae168_Ps1]OLL84727.1 hypothetical protein Ae263Ps1_1782 [Pseudonocardia sp. Ae263_Ps1]OLL95256.1 hypothetical protein Ae356Ps1_5153c [Pseudonocardia sp. Ae356_Ps1]
MRYACLADPVAGTVVAAHGTTGHDPEPDGGHPPAGSDDPAGAVPDDVAAVLGWGSAEAGRTGPAFEDAVITTGEAYHLVRVLPRDGTALLAYLRVDRVRGNLALARRALLALPADPSPPANTSILEPAPPATDHPDATASTMPRLPAVVVPEQAAAPAVERTPRPVIPLPRREPGPAGGSGTPPAALAPAPRTAGPAAADEPAAVPSGPPDGPGGGWADDLRTMARILAGLRRLDRSPTTDG